MIRIDVLAFILLGLLALGIVAMIVSLILIIKEPKTTFNDIHCNDTGDISMDDTVITTIPYDKIGLE